MDNIQSISILGGGNVAYHFAKVLQNIPSLKLVQIYNRSPLKEHFTEIRCEKTTRLEELKPADLYLICVKDSAIAELSEQLPFTGRWVAHTSGNTDIQQINPKNRRAVIYPAQSFTVGAELDFSQIPFCIEAEPTHLWHLLETFVQHFSQKIYKMDSHQRRMLHISAVFCNNFVNHLWYVSQKICQENDISFEIIRPLLAETFQKAQKTDFYDAQTGPARRHDFPTIEKHLSLLQGTQKEIYQILTNSILNTYGEL